MNLIPVGQVGLDRDGPDTPSFPDLGRPLLDLRESPADQRDVSARPGETVGDCLAEAVSLLGPERKGAQRALLCAFIGLNGAVGGRALAASRRNPPSPEPARAGDKPWFAVGYGSAFLATFGVLRAKKGLPDRLAAKNGVTPDGTPAAGIAYTLACAGLAAATLVGAATRRARTRSGRLRGRRRA